MRGMPSGSAVLSIRYSEVSLLPAPMSTQFSSRLLSTPSQNRSSGST